MPADRLYELIARKLSGEATDAEQAKLNTWLQGNTGDQYLYEILARYWSQHPDLLNEDANEEEERFNRILLGAAIPVPDNSTEAPVRKFIWRKWLTIAAVFIALAGAAYLLYITNNKPVERSIAANETEVSEVVAKPGSRSKIILPDGTQVWLNAESKLTYLSTFNKALREVRLEGEAYFDVTHDAARPFIVHTSNIDIKVLGTAFTVKSFATDNTIEATLLRGSIEVVKQDDPASPKVILRPHEKLVFNKDQQTVSTRLSGKAISKPVSLPAEKGFSVTTLPRNKPDSVIKELSWVYNKLVFDGEHFDELAVKMERWYDVHFTFSNERLKQFRFKATFENETIQEALDALKLTAPFEYRMSGDNIEIINR